MQVFMVETCCANFCVGHCDFMADMFDHRTCLTSPGSLYTFQYFIQYYLAIQDVQALSIQIMKDIDNISNIFLISSGFSLNLLVCWSLWNFHISFIFSWKFIERNAINSTVWAKVIGNSYKWIKKSDFAVQDFVKNRPNLPASISFI